MKVHSSIHPAIRSSYLCSNEVSFYVQTTFLGTRAGEFKHHIATFPVTEKKESLLVSAALSLKLLFSSLLLFLQEDAVMLMKQQLTPHGHAWVQ